MLYILGVLLVLAVLAPFFGSDTRDGHDWSDADDLKTGDNL